MFYSAKLLQFLMNVLFSEVIHLGVLLKQAGIKPIPVSFALTLQKTEISEILILFIEIIKRNQLSTQL